MNQLTQKRMGTLRILIGALGGEGGSVLTNWIIDAAQANGFSAQATSVPGVAQRTGSTSYYIEIGTDADNTIFGLVPMPGRVDVVLASELIEAARLIESGYVSPDLTTLITSTNRTYTTAEKIKLGDGRFDVEKIVEAAHTMAKSTHLLDLQQLAIEHQTFISATLYGALLGSGVLPWSIEQSKSVLGSGGSATASLAGIDSVISSMEKDQSSIVEDDQALLPVTREEVIELGYQRLYDYQDKAYADLYRKRCEQLDGAADSADPAVQVALTEACRRLALWMSYEDIARVADLKTRPERLARIRMECQLKPDEILSVTEYLKPRMEEVADMLPQSLGSWLMKRQQQGKGIPLLGRGRHICTSSGWGYWMLRLAARLKRSRKRSLRYQTEQQEIEQWLSALSQALPQSTEFSAALAELPRLRKGYSDTLSRGLSAYRRIFSAVVEPTLLKQNYDDEAPALQEMISAALADDQHQQLDRTFEQLGRVEIPLSQLQSNGGLFHAH